MPTYAVKRSFPDITIAQLSDIQKAAIETSNQLTREGIKVEYIRSNFHPDDSSCTCFFEAINKEAVKAVIGSTPHAEIMEVLDLES